MEKFLISVRLSTLNQETLLKDKFLPIMVSEMRLTLSDTFTDSFQRSPKKTSSKQQTTRAKSSASLLNSIPVSQKMLTAASLYLSSSLTTRSQSMNQLKRIRVLSRVNSLNVVSTRMSTRIKSSSPQQTLFLEAMSRSTGTTSTFCLVMSSLRTTYPTTFIDEIVFSRLNTFILKNLLYIIMMASSKLLRNKLNLPTLNANRQAFVLQILEKFDEEHLSNPGRNIPLDLFLRYFFLNEKSKVDSLDREAIVDYVYHLLIWKAYLNAICKKPMNWQSRLKAFLSPDFTEQQSNEGLPM